MRKRTVVLATAMGMAALGRGAMAASERLVVAPVMQPATPDKEKEIAQKEIAEIRARIAVLEARVAADNQRRAAAERAAADRSTAAQLQSDAASHDRLLTAEGFTAGYSDDRFVIQSADGKFVLRPWSHFQFRGVVLDRKDFQGTAKNHYDEVDSGFEIRQLRIGVDGNVFSPDMTYFINWATQRTSSPVNVTGATPSKAGGKVTVSNSLGGGLVLQQAWVKYRLAGGPFYIRGGQLKDPLLHEQIVDTRYQLAAERSISADILTNGDDYTEAATVIYDPADALRAEAGVNHGMRSANTNFLDYPNNGAYNAFDYGVVGRVEYKVMGRWKDYNQVTAVGTTQPLLVLGTGADYSERGRDGQLVAVADAMYAAPCGLSVYGEFIDRYTTHNFGYYVQSATGATINAGNPAVAGKPTNEYAAVIQAGYILNQRLEPFGRYEFMHLQGTPVGSHNWIQAVTGGLNYYFVGHRLKLTGEAIWLPNGLPFDDTSSDVLTTSGKAEISFVAQLQFVL